MPPKKADPKKKPENEPPKELPDLEWDEIPYIASSYNYIYNQKIRYRIRSLFNVLDADRKERLDFEKAALMIRAAGLFPTDLEMDAWLHSVGRKSSTDVWYVDKMTFCDGIYELLREGRWKPPSPRKAITAWKRLDMSQRGSLNVENLTNIFAQEEKEDGMTPSELKTLFKYVSQLPRGELDYVNYVDQWYKLWLANRIPRPRDRIPRRKFDDTV
ncbi:uncharacterized protein LOC129598026 [Paramacrobiotus metropolitanus]|uniref:uncharacterized protein LOC129598026 n=1 Tax=Paramacrobiotus metropolitanus TaxID=2943436 RepID=UPI002445963B|nr:uncharacterized protein LOC129598026 [Paramacrobiotus metropolitanus]